MATGKAFAELGPARIRELPPVFCWLVLLPLLGGCASPGEPVTRRPPTPTAIDDLTAAQSGNNVLLSFAVPHETVEQKPLEHPPAVEIYRSFSPAAVPPASPPPPVLLETIPSDLVDHYASEGRAVVPDPLTPQDLEVHAGEFAVYMIRTTISAKRPSADSNLASVRVNPAPEPIADLQAAVIHSVVHLTWTPPEKTPIGAAPPVKVYHIYRVEIPPAAPAQLPPSSKAAATPQAPGSLPRGGESPGLRLEQIAETAAPEYDDSQVALGKTYRYAVRSIVEYPGEQVESSDSNQVAITVRNLVPPSAPQGLVVIVVPAKEEARAYLDLSWAINPEADVGGYNVYRSEQQGVVGTRLNSELLPTPTFSDMSALPGRRYFYSVTAVDRSGKESSPSVAVSGELPAQSQP
ncbi:MAG TPA: hypothetical protein VEJ67_01575 [Candidatus Cybelea sp.]|nr:hypothetical protein [Candidatus Cybelea sp.]